MLVEDFYHITELTCQNMAITAEIRLNPDHNLYQGHFPQQAVVPGVMQIQIIKELMENAVEITLLIREVTVAKYLRVVTPIDNQELHIQIEYKLNEKGDYLVNAVLSKGDINFTKVKVRFSESVQ